MKISIKLFSLLALIVMLASACASANSQGGAQNEMAAATEGKVVEYSLTTALIDGMMVYIGVGGGIDGVHNPTLSANVGDTVKINLTTGDGTEHDIAFPDFNAASEHVVGKGSSTTLSFTVDKGGTFAYYCTLPGHRQAGMEGKFEAAGESLAEAPAQMASGADYVPASGPVLVNNPAAKGADIVRDPTDLPGPISVREPKTVQINLEAVEIEGQLADGTTFKYWTFNGQVPGPFYRVRVGDTIEVHMKNLTNSTMPHSVDFHAVTGPGGGAVMTQTAPGEETMFTAKALNPGLYVYHCATPMVAQHIANGMYGLILVEPEEGLPEVDREFYVMQGEIYTNEAFGSTGLLTENLDALLDENPEYLVFNGAVGGLTEQKPLKADVGETVRIFFGVGGPNFTSSFHVIGEIFDRVYDQASLTSPALTNVQTTLVPPGGATMVEFSLEVPGNYILVDHALARLQRGLAGFLIAEGPENPEIFDGTETAGSGH
ncbi:MAG TPA: copper-containing nitrite reductase [Anaerolineales bacterium]|nr:copper-containing nitrite reductase [Anaerolineales bacterium]